jgi:predicted nucleotidyltransferase
MADYVVYHVEPAQKRRLIAAMAEALGRYPQVAFAFLYGSLLERSDVRDIDLGIYLEPTAQELCEGLWTFEGSLGTQLERAVDGVAGAPIPVDVRVVNRAPLPAQFAVLSGELVYLADVDEFARVVEFVVPRYLDLEPLRERALREVLSA